MQAGAGTEAGVGTWQEAFRAPASAVPVTAARLGTAIPPELQ